MNATHTTDGMPVELRGTRRIGRGSKSRLVALVYSEETGNMQVELDSLDPIIRATRAAVESRSLGYTRRDKATTQRSGLRLENTDRARLGVKGDSGARACVEYARNIAPKTLCDLVPKETAVLSLESCSRNPECPKAKISAVLRDATVDGKITIDQGMTLAEKNGIAWRSR